MRSWPLGNSLPFSTKKLKMCLAKSMMVALGISLSIVYPLSRLWRRLRFVKSPKAYGLVETIHEAGGSSATASGDSSQMKKLGVSVSVLQRCLLLRPCVILLSSFVRCRRTFHRGSLRPLQSNSCYSALFASVTSHHCVVILLSPISGLMSFMFDPDMQRRVSPPRAAIAWAAGLN